MSRIPNGIPTISYCRILPTVGSFGQGDIVNDGNAVVVLEPGQPSARFEVAQVIDKNFDDEETCEMTIGRKAGGGLGNVLNPISAFVNDAANVVLFLAGSRNTRKWQFLKRTLLPFIANEILSNVSDRSQLSAMNMYKAQLTVSALEIQDEVITDLLRPANRGLSIITNIEEGIMVQGLHRETVTDEMSLRRLLIESCDNRGIQNLPVGGNIDSSTGIFEFRLYQADNVTNQQPGMGGGNAGGPIFQTRECQSRLIVIDLPAIDPLLSAIASNSPEEMRLFAGTSLNKSLFSFLEVARKLNNPYRAQLAPFRASKLTHYVSELIGGNAIVVSMGQIIAGEPTISKLTLELLSYLNSALHYPLSGREISDTVRGLLTKYRSMLIYSQQEILYNHQSIEEQSSQTQQLQNQIQNLQKELAQAILDKQIAIEDRMKIMEVLELLKKKYQTILDEKLKQSEILATKEEEILSLGQRIIEKNLEISQLKESYEQQLFEQKQIETQLTVTIESLTKQIQELIKQKEEQEKELRVQQDILQQNHEEILHWKDEYLKKMKEYQDLKEKNIDISAELLTLVNQKEVYLKQIQEYEEERKQRQPMKQQYEDTIHQLENENKQLLQKIVAKDEEISSLRKGMNTMEQLTSKSRDKISKTKSLDSAINTEKGNDNEEEIAGTGFGKNGEDIARRMINAMKLSVEEKKEKMLLKQLYEWETKYNRLAYDAQLQKQLLDSTQQENQELREKYSIKLRDDIERPANSNAAASIATTGSAANENAMNDALSNLLLHYETIIDSIQQKMLFYQSVNDQSMTHYRDLYDHYHIMTDNLEAISQLFSDYSSIVNKILNKSTSTASTTALLPSASTNNALAEKKMLIESKIKMILENALKEQYQLSTTKLKNETEWLEEINGQEKLQAMTVKELQKKQVIEEKEKIAAIINTYQRNLQLAETKNVKLHQEMIDMQIQLKQLLSKQAVGGGGGVSSDVGKKDGGLADSNTDHPETQVPEVTGKGGNSSTNNNAVYESLTNEIRELKQLFLQHEQQPPGKGEKNPLAALSRRPSSQLMEVLRDVISGKNSGKITPQPPSIPKDGGLLSGRASATTKPVEGSADLTQLEPLKEGNILQLPVIASTINPTAPTIESTMTQPSARSVAPTSAAVPAAAQQPAKVEHPSHLKTQLIAAEEKIVSMSSRQMALEEELRSYQNYMKEIIPQYQKQIKQLQQKQKQQQQQQLNNQKPAASDVTDSDAGIKFPTIK